MAITVDHIRDVSFKQYFLGDTGETPANGKIRVNDNTYEVTFANGQVNARFTSGNWFTNLFRRKTMDRFKDALQTQYDNWVTDSAKATAAGFKNNQNITAVKDAVNKCFDIICEASGKLDAVRRDDTFILYTVTALDSVVGEITGVTVTGANADLFEAELVDEPAKGLAQVRLTLKADAKVSTKAKYKIALEFTVEGGITAVTKTLTVKVTQSKLKFSTVPKSSVLFQGERTTEAPAVYTVTLTAPAGARIESIDLSTKTPAAFWRSLGTNAHIDVTFNEDHTSAVVTVTVIDPSKVVNGKTYNVILDVRVEGQATNTAAAKLTVKTTVKK